MVSECWRRRCCSSCNSFVVVNLWAGRLGCSWCRPHPIRIGSHSAPAHLDGRAEAGRRTGPARLALTRCCRRRFRSGDGDYIGVGMPPPPLPPLERRWRRWWCRNADAAATGAETATELVSDCWRRCRCVSGDGVGVGVSVVTTTTASAAMLISAAPHRFFFGIGIAAAATTTLSCGAVAEWR